MTAFTPILWLDTYDLACSLRARAGLYRAQDDGTKHIRLRYPQNIDDPETRWLQSRDLAKWVELRTMLDRIRAVGDKTLGHIEFGSIFVELLLPGVALPWVKSDGWYAESYLRLHLPLRTNPAALLFVGAEAQHLLPGALNIVGRNALCSAINAGIAPRAHLVVDFRKSAGL